MVLALRKLGFEQIGDLVRTARAPLALRFGALIGRRLDQMFGHEPEPFDPVAPAELVRAERVFAEPIGAPETLRRQIGLLAQACAPACASSPWVPGAWISCSTGSMPPS